MRCLWLERTQPDRAWDILNIKVPEQVTALFRASVITNVGDGASTRFWTDRWILGHSILDLVPALAPFVRRQGWRTCSVRDALDGNSWLQDIIGGVPVQALSQLLQVCDAIDQVTLHLDQPDVLIWVSTSDGQFTTRSAYEHFFLGSVQFEPHKCLWRSWAPLRAKFFVWLALWNRCWTSDRLRCRGLSHPEACPHCDQADEDINHILLICVFAREIWFLSLTWIHLGRLAPTMEEASFQRWWRRAERRAGNEVRKAFNTMVILVSWLLWKHRTEWCLMPGVHQ
ncbi:hypothetical protein PR202_gb16017 [Eleusine coracana subsp. coracana]|uniref:Reverse transcriptase zinc-binding domain-containing protein n=1 Tax=Eleusine coracana subsp. coracana TaxID=191504 RepID=A0AAV5EZE8_ELECO|nr:hypothetical protein PR202_gb16017 [Eleusine coracana subsp. coracana]